MSVARAFWTTIGIASAGLCVTFMVLAGFWFADNFGVDRLLTIIGIALSGSSLLFTLFVHFRRRR